jgi:hypothetical protein
MATFRKIHVMFWSDPYVQNLTPEQKYFFLYLLTNEKTKQCGIYEISKKQISYDTGYTTDTVSLLLEYFIGTGKILYSEKTNEIAIKNWKKYNDNSSPKVQVLIKQEITKVKDKSLVQYIYSIGTVALHKEEEIEEEEEKEIEVDKESPTAEFVKNKTQFPKMEDVGDLTDVQVGKITEYIKFTKNVDIEAGAVNGLWGIFKMKNLTGEKFYKDHHDVFTHFLESMKYQKFESNGKSNKQRNSEHGKTMVFDKP